MTKLRNIVPSVRWCILLVCCIAVFCGCGHDAANGNGKRSGAELETVEENDAQKPEKYGTFEGLDAETEKQILLDFYNYDGHHSLIYPIKYHFTINQFLAHSVVLAYYGAYSGYIVTDIYVGGGAHRVDFGFRLGDGFIAQGPDYHTIAWKDGRVYVLYDLAVQGKLTWDEQCSIERLHEQFRLNRRNR